MTDDPQYRVAYVVGAVLLFLLSFYAFTKIFATKQLSTIYPIAVLFGLVIFHETLTVKHMIGYRSGHSCFDIVVNHGISSSE